jgi:tetratricopeptide (TPR) repeat protein
VDVGPEIRPDATRLTHPGGPVKIRRGWDGPACPVPAGHAQSEELMTFVAADVPDPRSIRDDAGMRQRVADLLASRRDLRATAADTGLSKTTIGELRARRRRITPDTLEKVVARYAPNQSADWRAAWDRVYGGQPGPGVPTPRELPLDVPDFVGRSEALAALDRTEVPLIAVTGTAGVGKTALAVHWAHRIQHRFPDGCVYLDLHGYDQGRPLEPGAAFAALLSRLGLEPSGSADAEGAAARYRTLLAGRRLLLLIDNAHDSEQVQLLLPGSATSLTLVTSRDGLTELRDRHGAHRLDLAPLAAGDAVDLLGRLSAEHRRDEAGLRALADRCAGLPLALRIAAGALTDQLGLTATVLADQLAEDDPTLSTPLRGVFASSYRYLDEGTAATFRQLGTHVGESVDLATVAALGDLTGTEARVRVDRLLRAGLLQQTGPGRFGMHDLLRRYAREQESAAEGEAATQRLLHYYIARSGAAAATLLPTWRPRRPYPEAEGFQTSSEAVEWLNAERPNLVSYAMLATQDDRLEAAYQLADHIWNYLYQGGHHVEAVLLHEQLAEIADGRDRADALERLAVAQLHLGRYADAERSSLAALDINRRLSDVVYEGSVLGLLGILFARRERNEEALAYMRRHLAIVRETGDQGREAQVVGNIGLVLLRWGRHREALDDIRAGIELAREAGSRTVQAIGLNNLGLALQRLGQTDEALEILDQAAALADKIGARGLTGQVLDSMGVTHARRGDLTKAEALLSEALQIHRETKERAAEAETLDNLGGVRLRQGAAGEALEMHRESLRIAAELEERGRAASANNGAGDALFALGDRAAARAAHDEALRIAGEIGNLDQQARALSALAALDGVPSAAAQALYARLGVPEANA